jgi:hypothetical protein
MPRLHKREKLIRDAESELRRAVMEVDEKYNLTQFEYIQLLHVILGEAILTVCKYGIRQERHGDTETPGGLEKD